MAQKELRCDLVTRSYIADCLVLAAPSIRGNPTVKCTNSNVGVLGSPGRQHFLQHEGWCNDHLWTLGGYHGSVGHGGEVVEKYIRTQDYARKDRSQCTSLVLKCVV